MIYNIVKEAFRMCAQDGIKREPAEQDKCTLQTEKESGAVLAMKACLAELEEICKACTEKTCSIYCETKRRKECYTDLIAGKGRHYRNW